AGNHLSPERLDELKDEELLAKLVPVNEDEEETFLALRELKEARVQLAAEMAQAAETPSAPIRRMEEKDPMVIDSQAKGEDLKQRMENTSDMFLKDVRKGYQVDPVFSKILGNPTYYP